MINQTELKVSVIISTFNRCNQLSRMVKSILQQQYENYQIIIIDDSSVDDTKEVISKMQLKEKRIIYERNSNNLGVSETKKRGYVLSSGDIVIFADDDDYYTDFLYFKKLNILYQNHPDCVITVANSIKKYEETSEYSFSKLNFKNAITTQDYFNNFMTSYMKPNSMFTMTLNAHKISEINFQSLKCFNDTSLYLFGLLCKGVVFPIQDYVGVYTVQKKSMSFGFSSSFCIENLESKRDIYNRAIRLDEEILTNPETWFYQQSILTIKSYFIGKIHYMDAKKVIQWICKNFKKKQLFTAFIIVFECRIIHYANKIGLKRKHLDL